MLTRHLAVRVNLIIAMILAIALGTTAMLTKRNWQQQAIEEAMTKATIMSATIMNSIIVEMSGFCQKDVQKIVANVGAVPEIDTVRVFDEDGIITYSADPEEVGLAVDSLDFSVYQSKERTRPFKSEESGHRSFCMVQPIENALECRRCHGHEREILGVLDVCVSMAPTEKRIAANSRFLFATTFTTVILVVIAISISMWILVNMPVNRLVRTMAKAEKGNLKARAEIRRQDELGRLAQSLNSMLEQLDHSEQELKRFHAEQLKRADRLATLGELAAGIAHEIKNPLAGIAGATQILAREFSDDDPRQPVTQEILKLIERLDSTIRGLLDFARPSVPQIVPTDLGQVMERTLFLVEQMPEIKGQGVAIDLEIDPEMPTVPVDPDLIRQVFLNMAVNAIQAMRQGGTLTVTVRTAPEEDLGEVHPAADYVMISFTDTGSGIEEDKLRSIFTPFFTTKTQGTGLGLPITMRIVEQHDGRITVSSKVGEGTTFRIYLRKELVQPQNTEDAEEG
ncbi:MAG: ATP-binding protein [bacterium]|nr:ATP-binding protein [bacterium]MDT8395981.1 ATP-binding protein [bacterium]